MPATLFRRHATQLEGTNKGEKKSVEILFEIGYPIANGKRPFSARRKNKKNNNEGCHSLRIEEEEEEKEKGNKEIEKERGR